ncbi:MAG TPA: AI-2E family transporter [Syntrophomonadaceae bacterium]|nr:AI-2E family transporter [Syntrophomonadaceae bacterium]
MHWQTSRTARLILVVILGVGLFYGLYLIREVLLTFILAAIIAYLFYRPARWIEALGVKRTWAILLLFLLVISVLTLALIYVIPKLAQEVGDLAQLLPRYAQKAQAMSDQVQNLDMPEKMNKILRDNIGRMEDWVYESLKHFLNSIYMILRRILDIIFAPILAFYIINDWEKLRDGVLALFSPIARRQVRVLFQNIDSVLIEFVKGNFIVACIVGLAVGVTALLLGVKLPLLLGLGAGITELIPYFGAFIGAIPAVAIGLSQSLRIGLYMGLAVFMIQELEANFISPKILGSRLNMHPLLMVFGLLAGGELFGIWGLIFSVPMVAVARVVIAWAYEKIMEVQAEQ